MGNKYGDKNVKKAGMIEGCQQRADEIHREFQTNINTVEWGVADMNKFTNNGYGNKDFSFWIEEKTNYFLWFSERYEMTINQ